MFFSIRMATANILWILLNMLSALLLFIYGIGRVIIYLSYGKSWSGEKRETWPSLLQIGEGNWILPYHFMMMGMCGLLVLDPKLCVWILTQTFLALVFLEFLGIFISYMHKWTDEAGTPLWTSAMNDDE